jgi:NADPH2 dehydrogenase
VRAFGRTASPEALAKENNLPLVSASPISLSARPIPVPHALTEPEIRSHINSFATAARNAIEVEIHAANGYLIDQFLQEVSNTREDDWGGSIEKRAKFAIEVTDAIVKEVGAEKVGVRLSPWSPFQGAFYSFSVSRRRLGFMLDQPNATVLIPCTPAPEAQ